MIGEEIFGSAITG